MVSLLIVGDLYGPFSNPNSLSGYYEPISVSRRSEWYSDHSCAEMAFRPYIGEAQSDAPPTLYRGTTKKFRVGG